MTRERYRRPESVLVVVYTDAGQVLLLERRDRPGFWQSVTGSLEPEETPAEAARRELTEETGLRGEPVDLRQSRRFEIFPAFRHRFPPGVTQNLEHAFAFNAKEAVEVTPDPAEHRDSRWLHWMEAAALTGSWTNRQTIESLFNDGR